MQEKKDNELSISGQWLNKKIQLSDIADKPFIEFIFPLDYGDAMVSFQFNTN